MAALADTNVLVYRLDWRAPDKQRIATALLHQGSASGEIVLAHQTVVEFVSAATKPIGPGERLLQPAEARREAEELLDQFEVLYPDEELVRLALRGAAAYGLSWFDAHMWAYAERFGLAELLSEDFEHGRLYGTVLVRDPFVDAPDPERAHRGQPPTRRLAPVSLGARGIRPERASARGGAAAARRRSACDRASQAS